MVTDAAMICPHVLGEPIPSAWQHVEQYAKNRIEPEHSRLKQRPQSMRGRRTDRADQVIISGHAFVPNLRRDHYELDVDTPQARHLAMSFTEHAPAI